MVLQNVGAAPLARHQNGGIGPHARPVDPSFVGHLSASIHAICPQTYTNLPANQDPMLSLIFDDAPGSDLTAAALLPGEPQPRLGALAWRERSRG